MFLTRREDSRVVISTGRCSRDQTLRLLFVPPAPRPKGRTHRCAMFTVDDVLSAPKALITIRAVQIEIRLVRRARIVYFCNNNAAGM